MKSKRTAILCLCLALCLLAGCAKYPLGITVTCKDLQVTVPGDFVNLSEDSYAQDADFLYGWNTLVFMGLAEDKSKLQEMTLEAYTALVISGNGRDCTPKPAVTAICSPTKLLFPIPSIPIPPLPLKARPISGFCSFTAPVKI